ncbi:MAG: hypothetical protein LC105_08205 [Chitinophagales bacterium]|nr:hypothetical protein [Chitinophagales bacterium]MCZ2393821.1 hypothetical protein [Chitinophagales bacterium]
MKENVYLPLLSLVIGWSLLAFITGLEWISYIALFIGMIGILSEKLAKKIMGYIHLLIQFIFQTFQKILLTLIYYLVFFPISLLNKKKNELNTWIEVHPKENKQLEKLW